MLMADFPGTRPLLTRAVPARPMVARPILSRLAVRGVGMAGMCALLALGACSEDAVERRDPLVAGGLFKPVHANRSNLVLMVANPSDLVRGQGGAPSDGQLAAAAIERLRTDKVKKLPASDVAQFGAGTSGENNGGGGGGGAQ